MAYIRVRDPDNPMRILFRYDPDRDLIEIKTKGEVRRPVVIDLTKYKEKPTR